MSVSTDFSQKAPVPEKSRVSGTHEALKIVAIYAALALLWELLSERAIAFLFNDPVQKMLATSVNGWLFILVTSLLLYLLLRRLHQRRERTRAAGDVLRLGCHGEGFRSGNDPRGRAIPSRLKYAAAPVLSTSYRASVTARTKTAKLETGLELQVPEYMEQGERVRVDTRTGDFVQRVQ